MNANYQKVILKFNRPAGTSRGLLETKETYILSLYEEGKKGIGECAIFRGLSFDDTSDYEQKLQWLCNNINEDIDCLKNALIHYPSIIIGLEQALLNLNYGSDLYFPGDFTQGKEGIKINGLIWMGNKDFVAQQIEEKLDQGFGCIKLKIGVDWFSEKHILVELRKRYPKEKLELRVDANGAFSFDEAKYVLQDLGILGVHSIEQPIKKGQVKEMRDLCDFSPVPIALDEELIGILNIEDKRRLLDVIKPQYIILKPSLLGGFSATDEWINLVENNGVGWWITSALESNIGLNAIAQYTYTKRNRIPQGLGTGALFSNNFEPSLFLDKDILYKK